MSAQNRNASPARGSRKSSMDRKSLGSTTSSNRSSVFSQTTPSLKPSRRSSGVSLASRLSRPSTLDFVPKYREGQALVDFLNEHIEALTRLKRRATFLRQTLIEEWPGKSVESTSEYKITCVTMLKIDKQVQATEALKPRASWWSRSDNWRYPNGDAASANGAVVELLKKAKTLDEALDFVESSMGEAAMSSLAAMGLPVTIIR